MPEDQEGQKAEKIKKGAPFAMKLYKKKKRLGTVLRVAALIFILYAMFSVVDQQAQISKKKRELARVNFDLNVQKVKNKELKEILRLASEKNNDYIERIARNMLDLVKQNERVFINVPGD